MQHRDVYCKQYFDFIRKLISCNDVSLLVNVLYLVYIQWFSEPAILGLWYTATLLLWPKAHAGTVWLAYLLHDELTLKSSHLAIPLTSQRNLSQTAVFTPFCAPNNHLYYWWLEVTKRVWSHKVLIMYRLYTQVEVAMLFIHRRRSPSVYKSP